MKGIFITGTDTGVGKTLVSLGLCLKYKWNYWKPVQTGPNTDTDFASQFLSHEKIFKSTYSLKKPLSPNQSAEYDQVEIDLKQIQVPQSTVPVVVEGIGGILVPFNSKKNVLDLIKQLSFPVIIVGRSGLGTLNHTLMTVDILKKYNIPILGIILSGFKNYFNKRDIENITSVPVLFELDHLENIDKHNLESAFQSFSL